MYVPNAKPNSLSFTYYINTKLLAQAINIALAEQNSASKENVISALDKIRDQNIGGFVGTFNRQNRTMYPVNVGIVKG